MLNGKLLSAVALLLSFSAPVLARSYYYYPGAGYYYAPVGAVPMIYGTAPMPVRPYYSMPQSAAPATYGATDYLSSVCQQGMYRWQLEKMPIKVWIADGTGIPGYKSVFQTYIRHGFDEWCKATGGKLSWVEVNDPAKADVTVRWTDHVTERPEGTEAGRTSALTKLDRSTGKGIIYGARMQFLTRLPDRLFADQEVEKTCLHEAGHALGLQGHSPYRDDIMYFAVGPSQMPMLTERDRNTLVKLYSDVPMPTEVTLGPKTSSPALPATSR